MGGSRIYVVSLWIISAGCKNITTYDYIVSNRESAQPIEEGTGNICPRRPEQEDSTYYNENQNAGVTGVGGRTTFLSPVCYILFLYYQFILLFRVLVSFQLINSFLIDRSSIQIFWSHNWLFRPKFCIKYISQHFPPI